LNRQGFYPGFVDSPCIKICAYDPVRRVCSGCGRTLEEITDWAELSDEDRGRIMAQLPARMSALRRD
jgi:uncharacterized protein